MNTAIISDRASNSGVGFAVPINQHGAGPLLGELRGGKVTRGVIGVQIAARCRVTTTRCLASTRFAG